VLILLLPALPGTPRAGAWANGAVVQTPTQESPQGQQPTQKEQAEPKPSAAAVAAQQPGSKDKPQEDKPAEDPRRAVRGGGTGPGQKLEPKRIPINPPGTAPVPGAKEQASPAVESTSGTPKAVADQADHDFGPRWTGTPLQHTFKITNTGDAPLQILKVRPGCGCTKAGKTPEVIEAGQVGEFPFELDSTKLPSGAYRKVITIITNDPANTELKLSLAGVNRRYVEVVPANASFGRITTGEPVSKTLKLTNNTDQKLELKLAPPAPGSAFDCRLTETQPGKEFELLVISRMPRQPGQLNETIRLATNLEAYKELEIRAMGSVPQRLDVNPSPLPIVNPIGMAPEQFLHRALEFTNFGDTPVHLLEATIDDPEVKLTVEEVKAGRQYKIDVAIHGGYELPQTGHSITLKTDDPEQPIITVPVQGHSLGALPGTAAGQSSARSASPKQGPAPRRPADELLGKSAPAFSAKTTAEKPLSNAELKDTITVLNFFAPNCPYCQKQLPRVESVRKEYAEKGIRFVNVCQTMRKKLEPGDVQKTVQAWGAQSELVLDPENVLGRDFRAGTYPTLFVVGKSGEIETVAIGNLPDLESRLRAELERVIAGRPRPAAPEPATGQPAITAPPGVRFTPVGDPSAGRVPSEGSSAGAATSAEPSTGTQRPAEKQQP